MGIETVAIIGTLAGLAAAGAETGYQATAAHEQKVDAQHQLDKQKRLDEERRKQEEANKNSAASLMAARLRSHTTTPGYSQPLGSPGVPNLANKQALGL